MPFVPVSIVWVTLIAVALWFFLQRTAFGRQVYGVGSGRAAVQSAGLKPRLTIHAEKTPGSSVLDGQVTGVQKACGTTKKRIAGAKYLQEFIDDLKPTGQVAKTIDKHADKGVNVPP